MSGEARMEIAVYPLGTNDPSISKEIAKSPKPIYWFGYDRRPYSQRPQKIGSQGIAFKRNGLKLALLALREGRPKRAGSPIERHLDELINTEFVDDIEWATPRGATQAAHRSELHGEHRAATLKRPAAALRA